MSLLLQKNVDKKYKCHPFKITDLPHGKLSDKICLVLQRTLSRSSMHTKQYCLTFSFLSLVVLISLPPLLSLCLCLFVCIFVSLSLLASRLLLQLLNLARFVFRGWLQLGLKRPTLNCVDKASFYLPVSVYLWLEVAEASCSILGKQCRSKQRRRKGLRASRDINRIEHCNNKHCASYWHAQLTCIYTYSTCKLFIFSRVFVCL